MDKRGSEKYYIIISLILGLIVLGLVLYFIFQEYFTQDELNWETCRQSIILRANMPADYISDIKDQFPLKCKSTPFVIKTSDANLAAKQVADIAQSCFYAVGEGKFEIFSRDSAKPTTHCIICARISIDSNIRNKFTPIPIWNYFNNNKINSKTYLSYFFSNFVDNSFVKRTCPDLSADSDFIKTEFFMPNFWEDPNKDLFVGIAYLAKPKVVFESWPATFGKLSCSKDFLPSALYQTDPPLYAFYVTNDIDKVVKDCTVIESIPA